MPEEKTPEAEDTPIIEIEKMSFAYGGRWVLENVNLSIPRGEFVSIVGPNGGGKTTLLKLLLGLIAPDEGTIRVFGEAPEDVRPHIGYVPQVFQFDGQFPVSVADVVLMGRLYRGTHFGPYRRADWRAAEEALREVDLLHVESRPFAALSGGERHRVLIARALVSDPELLLLDEPTTNLDVPSLGELYDLLQALHRRLTIVMVSHDMAFVSKLVSTVVCVHRNVRVHPTDEVEEAWMSELHGTDVRMVRHDVNCDHGRDR